MIPDRSHPAWGRMAPAPTRTSRIVARVCFGIVIAGILIGMFGAGRAAELKTGWVLWDVDLNQPWTSPKGYTAQPLSSATACSLDAASAANVAPKGTRLTCVRVDQRK